MREFLRNLQKNNKKGYTLAELLIVIAITGILAGFGFVEVAKYQRKLKRVEMDNTAREIFVAAQNHLTASDTSGNWAAGFYTADGTSLIKTSDWQNQITTQVSDYPESETEWKNHSYYYVIYNSSTYQEALTNKNSILTQLLPYGSADETVRTNGSYVIEIDASTATVYGVFYTDRGTITAKDLEGLDALRSDSTAREQYKLSADTKKNAIGYYGGAFAKKNQVNQLDSPTLAIFNDGIGTDGKTEYSAGTTILKANDPNVLEVCVYDPNYKDTRMTTLTITVNQLSSSNTTKESAYFTIEHKDASTIVINNKSNVDAGKLLAGIQTEKVTGGGIIYHISFDDIRGIDTHFNDLFPNMTPGTDISVLGSVSYSSDSSVAKVSDGKIGNSLFDSVIKVDSNYNQTFKNTGNYEAVIRTGRHLANLSEKISGYKGKENGFTLTSAILKNDIDWAAYAVSALGTDKNIVTTNSNGGDSAYDPTNQRFLAITNPTLIYFDGNNKKLSTFDISTKTGYSCGLFSNTKNLNSFTAKNLEMVDINTSSYNRASSGSFLGETNCEVNLTNIHVYNSSKSTYGSYISYSNYTAGGLLGTIGKNQKATIYGCSSSIMVRARIDETTYDNFIAGGLVGEAERNSTVLISQSYVGGKVEDDGNYLVTGRDTANISANSAGGLLGATFEGSNVTIENSYTTASVFSILLNGDSSESNAGGFIGYINGSMTCTSDYAAGTVNGEYGTSTGTFIGTLADESSFYVGSGSKYIAILDQISNAQISDTIGRDGLGVSGKISELTSTELKAFASGTTSAVPYNTNLSNSYPYPATVSKGGTKYTHHGDWCETVDAGNLVKHIVFSGTSFDPTAELKFIMAHTYFDVYTKNGKSPLRTISMSNASYQETDFNYSGKDYTYGFTVTMPIGELSKNSSFYFVERSDSVIDDRYGSYEYSDYQKQFPNFYSLLYYGPGWMWNGDGGTYGRAIDLNGGLSTNWYAKWSKKNQYLPTIISNSGTSAGPIFVPGKDSKYSLDIEFLNFYKVPDYQSTSMLYYENTGGTYQTNGLTNDITYGVSGSVTNTYVNVGTGLKAAAPGLNVTEDGYLFTIDSTYLNASRSYSGNVSALNAIKIQMSNSKQTNDYVSLQSLIDKNLIIDKTEELSSTLGISGKEIYQLNLDGANLDWTSMSALWSTSSRAQMNIKIPYSTFGGQTFNESVGSYLINPYFADTVQQPSDTNVTRRIRSTQQLKRITDHDGKYTFNTLQEGVAAGYTVTQELDLDLSAISLQTMSSISGVNYQGNTFTLDDGTTRYASLSGLKNTFAKTTDSAATISNLQVSVSADGLTADQIAIGTTEKKNYGAFVSELYGNLNNVTFTNIKLNNLQMGSTDSYYNGIGIIGLADGGTFTNVTVNLCEISDVTAFTDHLDLFGQFKANSTGMILKNISMHDLNVTSPDSSWATASLFNNGGTVGLISTVDKNKTLTNTTINTVMMYNITDHTSTTGIIGKVFGSISGLNVSSVSIYNDIPEGTTTVPTITGQFCGMIGSVNYGAKLNGLNIQKDPADNVGFDMHDLKLNTRYWGVIGYNAGTIDGIITSGTTVGSDSLISDVSFKNVDSSGAVAALTIDATPSIYAYGIIDENFDAGSIKNLSMSNVIVTECILPNGSTNDAVYTGIVALNYAGATIDNSSKLTHKLDIIEISKLWKMNDATAENLTDTVEFNDYGFVGTNLSATNALATIKNLTITNYTSGGYGFAFANSANSTISNIALGTASTPAVISKYYFISNNAGNINSSSVYGDTSIKQLCGTNTGTLKSNKVNGNAVTK